MKTGELSGQPGIGHRNFKQRAELLQSMYWQEREGASASAGHPSEGSLSLHTRLAGGEGSGRNFLLWQTFNYAKERVCNEPSVAAGENLFNDLLSVRALTYNLFHPIKLMLNDDPRAATQVLSNALGNFAMNVVSEINLYRVSEPFGKYAGREEAMDVCIFWSDRNGGKNLTAIRLLYADAPDTAEAGDVGLQRRFLVGTGLFEEPVQQQLTDGTQPVTELYRKLLVAERYREIHGLKDSFTVVLAPKELAAAEEEVAATRRQLKGEYRLKLKHIAMEQFVEALILYAPDFYKEAFQLFKERYLNFRKLDVH